MDFLSAAVQARCNVLISGGTGSGKTTLLNCLSRYIPTDERVITIEDAAELQLQQPHVVRLETRPANIEGKGEVNQRDLVKNCLRMRPDRVVIGECRGAEALDMLQAMNTGHEGSMTTIHANTTRDAIGRLEVMIAMAGYDIPMRALRTQIASAIQIVVQARRLPGRPPQGDGRQRDHGAWRASRSRCTTCSRSSRAASTRTARDRPLVCTASARAAPSGSSTAASSSDGPVPAPRV
jgi:Flp pilus assembly CpaF family ATPase